MADQGKSTREQREQEATVKARDTGKPASYIDDDGCEVTVMPAGHVFYNVADWW